MIRLYWIILLLMMAVAAHGQMDSTVINLKNVVVTGKAGTKSVTAERTRINPSATMSSATGSVLEVLRSSSAVTIDGSGQVSIRGNGNVLILVDGVPTTLDGLGSIPAANVQSIDIFHRANTQNMQMIQGFVNGDEAIIKQVNQRAWQSAIVLFVLLLLIALMIWLLISFGSYLYSLVTSIV